MIFTGLDGSKRVPVFPLITTTNPLQIKPLQRILFLIHTKIHTNYRRNLIPYSVVGIIETQPHGQKFLVMSGGKIKFPDIFLTATAGWISSTDFAPPHRIFRLMPIYPVCTAFIIGQCCHGTFSRSILGHLLLSGMFSPCHFCRIWT